MAACVAGLGVCGATWAVAGPTNHTDADLLDPMPPAVVKVDDDKGCTPVAAGSQQLCWRSVTVTSAQDETRAVFADRLARAYKGRGFNLNAQDLAGDRIWYGRLDDCGPAMVISTNPSMSGAMSPGLPVTDPRTELTLDPGGMTSPSSPGAGLGSSGALPIDPGSGVPTEPGATTPLSEPPTSAADTRGPVVIQLTDSGNTGNC